MAPFSPTIFSNRNEMYLQIFTGWPAFLSSFVPPFKCISTVSYMSPRYLDGLINTFSILYTEEVHLGRNNL